ELGEVIPRGSIDEQDLYIFTGSIFKKEDTYHIFYTGHNPHFDVEGKKVQAIMHAVSHDLVHWTKIKEDTFYSEGIDFELHDWRDPFVFEFKGEYKMAITARTKNTHKTRSGVTILYKSDDLVKWTFDEVIWMPSAYYAHECPDIFKINGKWYLIYSEFTDQCLTRYVVSDSLHGPWKALKNDAFDGRAFYAAKSITNDKNERFLFGWNPTKHEGNDKNFWHWGGSLEVHKI